MNGKINVTSKYGEGSVFEVRIPQKVVSDLKIGDISEKYNTAPDKKKKKLHLPHLMLKFLSLTM